MGTHNDLTPIKSRIVGYDTKPADQFNAHPHNWRKHPQRQREAVAASLRELGWIAPVIENRQTGNLIDGHERVWQALQRGEDVPYMVVDLSPEEEALALATFDAITGMAETDAEALDRLLAEVSTNEAALMELIAETAADAGLFLDKPEEADAEPQVSRADELQQEWQTETGQLWRLPSRTTDQEHRLICGDCTDAAVVERVTDIPLNLMVTDPPYGVEYDPNWRVVAGHNERTHGNKIAGDDSAAWRDAYRLFTGNIAYIWHASSMTHVVAADLMDCNFEVERAYVIVWNKDLAVFGRGDYHWKHELCRYVWRRGAKHNFIGDKKQTTVWDIPTIHSFANGHNEKEWNLVGHATQKPIECMARPIRHHEGDVYEPFCGSGTTIIAAENLARQCRAVEISPAYVAVALQRYQDAFGITPELVE